MSTADSKQIIKLSIHGPSTRHLLFGWSMAVFFGGGEALCLVSWGQVYKSLSILGDVCIGLVCIGWRVQKVMCIGLVCVYRVECIYGGVYI